MELGSLITRNIEDYDNGLTLAIGALFSTNMRGGGLESLNLKLDYSDKGRELRARIGAGQESLGGAPLGNVPNLSRDLREEEFAAHSTSFGMDAPIPIGDIARILGGGAAGGGGDGGDGPPPTGVASGDTAQRVKPGKEEEGAAPEETETEQLKLPEEGEEILVNNDAIILALKQIERDHPELASAVANANIDDLLARVTADLTKQEPAQGPDEGGVESVDIIDYVIGVGGILLRGGVGKLAKYVGGKLFSKTFENVVEKYTPNLEAMEEIHVPGFGTILKPKGVGDTNSGTLTTIEQSTGLAPNPVLQEQGKFLEQLQNWQAGKEVVEIVPDWFGKPEYATGNTTWGLKFVKGNDSIRINKAKVKLNSERPAQNKDYAKVEYRGTLLDRHGNRIKLDSKLNKVYVEDRVTEARTYCEDPEVIKPKQHPDAHVDLESAKKLIKEFFKK